MRVRKKNRGRLVRIESGSTFMPDIGERRPERAARRGKDLRAKPPTQASFVEVGGSNKWKTIIQNAVLHEENST